MKQSSNQRFQGKADGWKGNRVTCACSDGHARDSEDSMMHKGEDNTRDTETRDSTRAPCTFLPQLAVAPVQQSQDKADENGLGGLRYGWLKEEGTLQKINFNSTQHKDLI